MTRDRLKEELFNRIEEHTNFPMLYLEKLKDSIGTLIDQYHDEIAVMVQVAIESEAETLAARVRDTIKEVPCNLSY
jgi:hypothetical protein